MAFSKSLVVFFHILAAFFCVSVRSQDDQVCVPVQRGPAGPAGPKGDPGTCNRTDIDLLERELQRQNEQIQRLTQEIEDLRSVNSTNESSSSSSTINYSQIQDILNQELRKRNNCPIGLADGRIPDSSISASSSYDNDTENYGPHLGRLDTRPSGNASGAWRPIQIPPVPVVSCAYSIQSKRRRNPYSYRSNEPEFLPANLSLIFMVDCPSNCRRSTSYSVEGTGIYQDDSSICRAAIHAGRLSDSGGVVTVRRQRRRQYEGTNRHSIRSSSTTSEYGNFTFIQDDYLPWIQVDLQSPTHITGVVTQGRPTTEEEWVTSYKLFYGDSVDDLQAMKRPDGTDLVFRGNSDRNTPVKHIFLNPINARIIRLVVLRWYEGISLRLEYLTC